MRRLLLVGLLFAMPLPSLAAEPRLHIGPGDALFWSGPMVESSSGDASFDYKLQVGGGGERLRIGFDHPQVGDTFAISVDGPGAGESASFSVGPGIYSGEETFDSPQAGTWKITVSASTVTDSAFRMRAKLEERLPSLGVKKGPVLPNLQILPPHDASFMIPVTNGAADSDPTGIDAAGQGGCHPEEHVEDQAIRCLRFGFGVRNTGLGPMDLHHTGSSPLEHDLFQTVHLANGATRSRPAGRAVFHKTHGHFHHDAAVGLQLFRVTDTETGALEEAGAPRTKGFAHRNELIRDWDRFYPDSTILGFGLLSGWADIYEWDRPGNYIDFGLNGDGDYVIRMEADPVDGVLESNESDNFGYTYLRVTGGAVEILETGRGRDPWDRCKIVVGEGGFPDPPRKPRPSSCPSDTT